jgi:hypothetical protein
MLTVNDLRKDPIIVRKIKRMQREEARKAEELDAEDEEFSISPQPNRASQAQIKMSSSSRLQAPHA